MSFCPHCGCELKNPSNFCPGCGQKLVTEELKSANQNSETGGVISVHDLGKKLEEVVQKILESEGYRTETRKRIKGLRNYTNEIDIIAIRGEEKVAVECKNYSGPVGISQIRDFASKLEDLGFGWRGIFASYNDFTEDASEFAECRNIEILGHDEIKERWFSISVGRTVRRGDKLVVKSALPVITNFIEATSIGLLNKEFVKVSDSKLVYHPYIRIPYHLKGQRSDPTRQVHRFEDKGVVVVDLLDGEVINPRIFDNIGSLVKTIKSLTSRETKNTNIQRDALLREIVHNSPKEEISLTIGQEYNASALPAVYSTRDSKRVALQYIIERNTQEIRYSVNRRESFPEIRTMDYIPKREEIHLSEPEIINAPKWTIHFNSFGLIYTREILACSGTVIEDTIRYCPKHFKLGSLVKKEKSIAVCEVCGQAFCKEHVHQCPVCGKWLCTEHSVQCNSCIDYFCNEHASGKCSVSNKPLCMKCSNVCVLCQQEYGKNHAVRCDRCGQVVCENCVTISGLIRKMKLCKRCA